MKNLTTVHYSVRQSVLSDLVNTSVSDESQRQYNNIKISLLNNAIVFPVPLDFQIQDFSQHLAEYLNTELKANTAVETYGDDIFALPFSTIVLIKKAVVYHLMDSHLYVNVLPIKEMENANYTEGAISELISSGKSDKIYDFVEDYILAQYPADGVSTVKPYGRYFYTTSVGLSTILASHLEEGERILAKLDIHKIEKSKSNAQTAESDEAFYLNTTHGSYIMVLDDNLQEKYVETLSEAEMRITSKLTRDLVSCDTTQWLCTRDNNKIFAEIAPINNIEPSAKLAAFAQQHFNNADQPEDKLQSAKLLRLYAELDGSPFAKFQASLIEYSASLVSGDEADAASSSKSAVSLMESANSLLSETDFEGKLSDFLTKYKFTGRELLAIIFAISRAKNRIADTKVFANVMSNLKERYFKLDSDSINRSFVSLSIAKKLNMIGEREQAGVFASDAYDTVGFNYASMLAPGLQSLPCDPFAGDAITYSALEELYRSAQTDKDKVKFAMAMAEFKPLIKSNFDNVLKLADSDEVRNRFNSALAVFSPEQFNTFGYLSGAEISGKFSKLSDSTYMPSCTEWRKTYSGFKSWAQKSQPDRTFSSIKGHGSLVDTNNYHLLYTLCEQLGQYFELADVDVYVFQNRNQGIMSNDDGEGKYIFVDAEQLDTQNANYLNACELTFLLAREYASLKLGFSRLTCHPQWRNFATLGVNSVDVISTFAKDPDFIKGCAEDYTRISAFNKLISTPDYFNFDVEDVEKASDMLSDTLRAVEFAGDSSIDNIKELEFSALSQLTAQILDRIGLLLSGNVVYAIRAIIHNDQQIRGGLDFCQDKSVAELACNIGVDDKPVNYDFAMRLDALLSFYISDKYKKY